MKKRWIAAFLVVSAMANIAFFSGYVRASLQDRDIETVASAMQPLIRQLGLREAQLISLRDHRAAAMAAGQRASAKADAAIARFWDGLDDPEFHEARLAEAIAEVADLRAAMSLEVARELHGFMRGLDEDQRAAFVDLVRARPILAGRFLMTTPGTSQADETISQK